MRLTELLQRRDQSFTELAKSVGTTPQTISRIISGARRPSLAMAQRIAQATHSRLSLVGTEFQFSPNTGNSAKAWYLLSEPADLPVIEVAFLNGQESPTIETAEADFNVLGIQMRGYHDFGVALQDPRGGVKSKGEN